MYLKILNEWYFGKLKNLFSLFKRKANENGEKKEVENSFSLFL